MGSISKLPKLRQAFNWRILYLFDFLMLFSVFYFKWEARKNPINLEITRLNNKICYSWGTVELHSKHWSWSCHYRFSFIWSSSTFLSESIKIFKFDCSKSVLKHFEPHTVKNNWIKSIRGAKLGLMILIWVQIKGLDQH